MSLFQEEGDAWQATCTEKGHWWGVASIHTEASLKVSEPTAGSSCSSAQQGTWGKRGLDSWEQQRETFTLLSKKPSSPLKFLAWRSEKRVSPPCKIHPLAMFEEQQ